MSEQKAIADQTVKALSWQLLYSNYARALGPEGWKQLSEEVGAPEFRRMNSDEDTPMEPFNHAVTYIDRVVGTGDGSKIREITRASVQRWANIYRNLVSQLQSRPQKMLEIFCTEVHPYFLNDPGASGIVRSAPQEFVLRLDNALLEEFKVGLIEGFVEITGARAQVESLPDGSYRVTWKLQKEAARPSRLALFTNATRAPFLTATAVPVLLGTAIAWKDGFGALDLFLLTLVGATFFHLGTNIINDYFDHRSGVDEANLTPGPFSGGSRVIQRGLMHPRSLAVMGAAFYAAGIAIGLHLAATRGWPILLLGILGFLLGVLYTAPPVRLSHRGLGELAVAAGFGPLMVVGSYFVQTQGWSLETLYISLPVGVLIASVLYMNEFPDRRWDEHAGKNTLVVRLPLLLAIRGYDFLLFMAYLLIIVGAVAGLTAIATLAALVTLPLAWAARQLLKKNHRFPYRLIPANAYTVFLHLITGLLLFYAYVATGLSRVLSV